MLAENNWHVVYEACRAAYAAAPASGDRAPALTVAAFFLGFIVIATLTVRSTRVIASRTLGKGAEPSPLLLLLSLSPRCST